MTLYGAARTPDAVAALIDSTGGASDGTLDDVSTVVTGVDGTGANAASKADVDARLAAINDNFAEINAKLDELLAALKRV